MIQHLTRAGAALAAILAAAPVFADQSAQASLTNFGITLYDLNPSDGITPSLTLSGSSSYAFDSATAAASTTSVTFVDDHYGYSPLAPVAAQAQVAAVATATSSLTGDLMAGGITIQALSTTQGPSRSSSSGEVDLYGGAGPAFTLSPGTLLVMSGTVMLSTASTDSTPSAQARLLLQLSSNQSFEGQSDQWFGSIEANASLQETVFLSMSNPGTSAADGTLTGSLYAATESLPVPEPASAALLLAGLGLLGATRRVRHGGARPGMR